jgi:hypothetical protein
MKIRFRKAPDNIGLQSDLIWHILHFILKEVTESILFSNPSAITHVNSRTRRLSLPSECQKSRPNQAQGINFQI